MLKSFSYVNIAVFTFLGSLQAGAGGSTMKKAAPKPTARVHITSAHNRVNITIALPKKESNLDLYITLLSDTMQTVDQYTKSKQIHMPTLTETEPLDQMASTSSEIHSTTEQPNQITKSLTSLITNSEINPTIIRNIIANRPKESVEMLAALLRILKHIEIDPYLKDKYSENARFYLTIVLDAIFFAPANINFYRSNPEILKTIFRNYHQIVADLKIYDLEDGSLVASWVNEWIENTFKF